MSTSAQLDSVSRKITESRSSQSGPLVKLLNCFDQPLNNSVATARTCYSSRIILPDEVAENEDRKVQRDRISKSIFKAGHHTTLQHATFQFILDKVSRQFIWSFLHAHPFYNSEQVSQRYVEVKPENFLVPEQLSEKGKAIYLECVRKQMGDYQGLIQILKQPVEKHYLQVFPKRDPSRKDWQRAMKKKAMEVARYVLPVSTYAHLYHTISGITLLRYNRLMDQFDVPYETKQVVSLMMEEVLKIDPDFALNVEDTIPIEETLEYRTLSSYSEGTLAPKRQAQIHEFIEEFDTSLNGLSSVLVGYPSQAEENLSQGVRSVLGLPRSSMSNAQAIATLFDPSHNRYLSEALNLTTLSKAMRSFHHCHFTFRKKISHTADSQDQRHRLTPGSRPVLQEHFRLNHPDFITPPLISDFAEAQDRYEETMGHVWQSIEKMLNAGESLENSLYLLPNAFPIRFEESGDMVGFHHKWTTRLCYNAQEEIWQNCRDEVLQVKKIMPEVGQWLHPPCTLRHRAKETPFCPEGDRFCGVRVWKMQVEDFTRVL